MLPFTNLIKTAPAMNATQLKDILEHGFGSAATTPSGGQEGRFPQLSGLKVFYNSADGYIRILDGINGVSLQYDLDGSAGPSAPRPLVTLRGAVRNQIVPARDLIF